MMIAFMVYMHGLTLAWNLGYNKFNMGAAMLPGVGLIFLFAGVMMRKAKRNFFIGIRTPWTLSSDYVWNETHRIGSILFIISGSTGIIRSFLSSVRLLAAVDPGVCFGHFPVCLLVCTLPA